MTFLNKVVTQEKISGPEAAISTCNEIVELFAGNKVPEIQLQLINILLIKRITLQRTSKTQAALATYSEVLERFGDSEVPEIQAMVLVISQRKSFCTSQLGQVLVRSRRGEHH